MKWQNLSRVIYIRPHQHFSLGLMPAPDQLGRIGTTICGLRNAIDQQRVSQLAIRHNLPATPKIHELEMCRKCCSFLDLQPRTRKDRPSMSNNPTPTLIKRPVGQSFCLARHPRNSNLICTRIDQHTAHCCDEPAEQAWDARGRRRICRAKHDHSAEKGLVST